jgi:tetratricopeptide (TPR) repeat protein
LKRKSVIRSKRSFVMRSRGNSSRWLAAVLLLALILHLTLQTAKARYVTPELVNIPVERLTKNLEELVRKNPKDVQVRLNLARVYAMAYALKTGTAQVRKGKENEGAWFGNAPAHVPFTAKPTGDQGRLKTAREHLASAIVQYEEVLKLAPDNLTAALGYAWCLEQSGDKEKAVREYRRVIEAAWDKEKDMERAPLGWHSVTAEAAGYLIPLLDKDKDKEEIRMLQDRIKRMKAVPRPITPVVIPLRDGLALCDLEDRSASVAFDADGTGLKKRWTWITKDAGWLIYDPRGTGKITSALQMFGSVTFWMFWDNGYQALSALDDDGDGMLTGKELQGLGIWQDIDGNGISGPGEVTKLARWGIVGISSRHVRESELQGWIAYSPRGVIFRDGSSRPTYDLILRQRE